MAIFSMQIKIRSWEKNLDVTCDEFVCMGIQELYFLRLIFLNDEIVFNDNYLFYFS